MPIHQSSSPTSNGSTLAPLQFRVTGMDCAEEVAILKRELGPIVGGEHNLAFDVIRAKMTVTPPAGVTVTMLQNAVSRTGMHLEEWPTQSDSTQGTSGPRISLQLTLVAASGVLSAVGFAVHAYLSGSIGNALGSEGVGFGHWPPPVAGTLYLLAVLSGVWLILPKAVYSARRLTPDMNLLMVIAVAGALVIGDWFEAATVAFLFSLSHLLESWSVGRARRAIASLLSSIPKIVRVLRASGEESRIPPSDVAIGDLFIVLPGEEIPLDGRIVRGSSQLNEAPITGESVPKEKTAGEQVFAGTVNGDGALEIECIATVEHSKLARIVQLVEEAQTRRAPSEQWVESFARIYTPIVLLAAIAVFILPPLAFGWRWNESMYQALVLLVIACPCALVISTPVSIVAGLAAAASRGVLIKGGVYLELPSRTRVLALDKTGTLTVGHPTVAAIVPLNGHNERELLERAVALESRSDHPLARAIVLAAQEKGIVYAPATDVRIVQGKGAIGKIAGRDFWVGSHRLLKERGQETAEVDERLQDLARDGHSVVVIGNDEHVCGYFAISDQVRSQARATIQRLKELGISKTVMLTGDNQATAAAVARLTGVDEFQAELLPEDKVKVVQSLIDQYRVVAVVGDGINDAPALATATYDIAMGASGSDAAIETADIALMSDDLSNLPWLIRHSTRVLAVIRANIIFSLSVKAIVAALALLGWASLWAAIAADMGASLIVVANGLRLLRRRDLPLSSHE